MSLQISRVLHAGYIFKSPQVQILFDPVFENPFSHNCYAFPSVKFKTDEIRLQKFDAVFISHYHDDHLSLESLDLIDKSTPIYLFCIFDEMFELIRALGFTQVHSLLLGETITVADIKVTPHRALDADVDSIFQIQSGSLNILNVVDSWIDDSTLEILARTQWDLILWPFQTMRELEVLSPSRAEPRDAELPPEWMEQLKTLNPKCIVPSSCQFIFESWSWYNHAFFPVSYQRFTKEMNKNLPGTQVLRLNPGESVNMGANSICDAERLSWIEPIGEQNVDYVYDFSLQPTATSEITKKFSALTSEQAQKVLDYCKDGLLKKYKSLNEHRDDILLWHLSVYNHLGEPTDFYFELNKDQITAIAPIKSPNWKTEIPMAKFYSALFCGEALTSLYMRIDSYLEAEVTEDPLMRCLFDGVFAEYQKAQLQKLRS